MSCLLPPPSSPSPLPQAEKSSAVRPELSVEYDGAQPFIDWIWDEHSALTDVLELQVDRGRGWRPLGRESTPGFLDSTPVPVMPVRWKYRGIYCVADQPVGAWSQEVSIIVGG